MRATTLVAGGGCSGVLTALQLLRHTDDFVVVVDPDPRLGRGVAYGTTDNVHLLNSWAGTMSADPDEPDEFVTWGRRGGLGLTGASFATRRDYGRYLEDALHDAAARNPGRLRHLRATVTDLALTAGGVCVTVDGATVLPARRVVLTIGHAPPATPDAVTAAVTRHPRFVADPWRPGVLDRVPLDAPVLLLGTGLTAVDVAASLTARGLRAPIHAVSRHGLLPQAHTNTRADPPITAPPRSRDLRRLVRHLRTLAAATDWRTAVDALRPYAGDAWASLSTVEQQRFLRHLARHWEVHRHRMAPQIAILVRGLIADGQLTVHRARLAQVTVDGAHIEAVGRDGGRWRVGTVINCCGPAGAHRTTLGSRLLTTGLARTDPHSLGLDVDPHGRLVSATGQADLRVSVIGPARRGRWWETTAVPEIRTQAFALLRPHRGSASTTPLANVA